MYSFFCSLRTLSHEYDCLSKISTKEMFTLLHLQGKKVKCQWQATCADSKQSNFPRQKYNMKKTHLLLQILAVISRYGSHLMIVMIFVTQNNF